MTQRSRVDMLDDELMQHCIKAATPPTPAQEAARLAHLDELWAGQRRVKQPVPRSIWVQALIEHVRARHRERGGGDRSQRAERHSGDEAIYGSSPRDGR